MLSNYNDLLSKKNCIKNWIPLKKVKHRLVDFHWNTLCGKMIKKLIRKNKKNRTQKNLDSKTALKDANKLITKTYFFTAAIKLMNWAIVRLLACSTCSKWDEKSKFHKQAFLDTEKNLKILCCSNHDWKCINLYMTQPIPMIICGGWFCVENKRKKLKHTLIQSFCPLFKSSEQWHGTLIISNWKNL